MKFYDFQKYFNFHENQENCKKIISFTSFINRDHVK